jgi:hypothetical protein
MVCDVAEYRARLLAILATLDRMETGATGIRDEPVYADIDAYADEPRDMRGKAGRETRRASAMTDIDEACWAVIGAIGSEDGSKLPDAEL